MSRTLILALALGACGAPASPAAPISLASSTIPAPRIEPSAGRFLGVDPPELHARSVSVGGAQTCVVTPSATLSCWATSSSPSARVDVLVPGRVVEVAMGASHGCARTEEGDVYCWGGRGLSELGAGEEHASTTPVRANVSDARALRASGLATCATLGTGELVCWGMLPSPETGVLEARATPSAIPMRPARPIIAIDEGRALAVDADGQLWAWGPSDDPARLADPFEPAHRFAELGAIADLTSFDTTRCASTATGLFCWGPSVAVIVGFPPPPAMTPQQVEGAPPNARLASGHNYVCALDASSQVSCAGMGDLVDEHDGIWTLGPRVRRIGALDGTTQMSARGRLLCGVRGDESVHCVGARDVEPEPPPS